MHFLKKLAAATSLAALGLPVSAQFDNVGSIDFPTSATAEAQQHFLRGVAILHSFGWEQAVEQFQAAQAVDPDFALAYWGESLSYNHPLYPQMNSTKPREVLQRLGENREDRLAKAPTEREKGFLNAVEILWGEGDLEQRRIGYMEAMAELYEQYPDDHEIAAFYALSILSARSAAGGDRDYRMAIRAGTIALDIFNANPIHPGSAHYTIHAFDDPVHAPLALEAAYRFADIAPAVSHARHMPTHIFIQHGMWDLVSGHNLSAHEAAMELWEPGQSMGDAIHSLDWGQYGDLQRGDYEHARWWMERIETMSRQDGFTEGGARGQGGAARALNTVGLLHNRYIVDTEEWSLQQVTADSPDHELLATALSAYHLEEEAVLEAAEKELRNRVDAGQDGFTAIMANQASALMHAAMNHPSQVVEYFNKAVAIISPMPPPRGSANPIKPLYEMYGEVLLDMGKNAEAIEQFALSLERMPNRPRSLLGMARAQAAIGHSTEAEKYYQVLLKIWEGDSSFEGVIEANKYLDMGD